MVRRPALLSASLLALAALAPPACVPGGGEASATETASSGEGSTDPTATAVCGDGEIGAGEVCDGAALDGKQCADLDPSSAGALACASDCASFDTSGCMLDPNAPRVLLNEVIAKGATTGPYAGMGDAIELFNAGGGTAVLDGYRLSDDPTFPLDKTYVFPPGSALAPGDRLVLVEFAGDTVQLPFGISLMNEETLTLADSFAVVLDEVTVPGGAAAVSYCRLPDGTGAWQACDQTLGAANQAASTTCGDGVREGDEACDGDELGGETCVGLGFTGGALACSPACVLDASMCRSDSPVALNELESVTDRIELYNAGDVPADLSGWILTDDPVHPSYDPILDVEKLVFPPDTVIGVGEFLVLAKGDLVGQHPFGLSTDGDTVTLLAADLSLVSQVSYGPSQAALSFCRVPDGPDGTWVADCVPTLGAANNKP